MKTLFNLLILSLAIWGVFHIEYKDRTLFRIGIEYLEQHDIRINTGTMSKLKSLFPSWQQEQYDVYTRRESKNN